MGQILFVGGSTSHDSDYSAVLKNEGHSVQYIEAKDLKRFDEILHETSAAQVDLTILKNLRGLIADSSEESSLSRIGLVVAAFKSKVLIFDLSSENLAHRLGVSWPPNVGILEACTQFKENKRRLLARVSQVLPKTSGFNGGKDLKSKHKESPHF